MCIVNSASINRVSIITTIIITVIISSMWLKCKKNNSTESSVSDRPVKNCIIIKKNEKKKKQEKKLQIIEALCEINWRGLCCRVSAWLSLRLSQSIPFGLVKNVTPKRCTVVKYRRPGTRQAAWTTILYVNVTTRKYIDLPDRGGLPTIKIPADIMQNPRQGARWDTWTDLKSTIMNADTINPSATLNTATNTARKAKVFACKKRIVLAPTINSAAW